MEVSAILVLGLLLVLLSRGVEVEASEQINLSHVQHSLPEKQPYMTAYHFRPPQNWLNDPNGPMFYNGVYHLFYQYNPNGALFGDEMIWAHSVSYDLINWISLNHALVPSDSFDINSCWSGSVTFLLGNKPVILYTGIDSNKNQVQNLATPKNLSDPFLREWVKYAENPVMVAPRGADETSFRDPTTAWLGSDGKWRVIVGTQNGNQGLVTLFHSEDFLNWTAYRQPLYESDKTGMWECPDFYPVEINSKNGVDTSVQNSRVRHVLKTSLFSDHHDYYILGTYDSESEKFAPDINFTGSNTDLRYDYGKFYASKTFFDHSKKRRILWGWLNESDSEQDDVKKGWAGLQAFPRQVWLDKSGKQLIQWPIEEIIQLRDKQVSISGRELSSGSIVEVSGITVSQADIVVHFELPDLEDATFMDISQLDPQILCSDKYASISSIIGPFGLLALASKDLTEHTAIYFRIFKGPSGYIGLMCSDQSRSSLSQDIDKTTYGAFIDVDPNLKIISLRTLIDHSIIENFAQEGKVCMSSRVYPLFAAAEEAHLYVFNNGTTSVTVSNLDAWNMNKIRIENQQNFSCDSA